MGKKNNNKDKMKSLTLEELGNLKLDNSGFTKKSPAEIEKMEQDKHKPDKKKPEDYLVNKIPDVLFSKEHISGINPRRAAKAPYNFIPLNDFAIPAEFSADNIPDMSFYSKEKNTGYISVNLEAKTPLYIRDTFNKNELKNKEKNDSYINSNFYAPGGLAGIPGSSIRGLIRTLTEIVTFGSFGEYDDKTIYFRDFTNPPLKSVYAKYGLSNKEGAVVKYNMNCGLLYKEGRNYLIKDYGNPRKIKKENTLTEATSAGKQLNKAKWEWFKTSDGKRIIIIPGGFDKKKDWMMDLYELDENEKRTIEKIPEEISLSSQDIKDYDSDYEFRKSNLKKDLVPNLLKIVSENKEEIPIFFYKWNDNAGNARISISHTGMIRIPYKMSIGEHVPRELRKEGTLDITTAIFGHIQLFAGRVFFEDAKYEGKPEDNIFEGIKSPKILSGPKPSTFQHYLIQNTDVKENLYHYNSSFDGYPIPIRGNKMYWHKDIAGNEWAADIRDINRAPKQYTKINPVKAGTSFEGRIRFENLSDIELGALLFALDLPAECCHKIGMGKPLGLGSVRITPAVHLSNREKRYTNITWESTKVLPVSDSEEKNKDYFKNKFATYILNNLNNDSKAYKADDLWEVKRMNELKTMLNFDRKPDRNKTRYMKIEPKPNEFRNRPVLPKPTDV